MTKEEYFKFHTDFCEKMSVVTKKKNADYTGEGDEELMKALEKEEKKEALTKREIEVLDLYRHPERRVFKLKPDRAYNPYKKFPRNLPCFCGSGKKFKKCHESEMSDTVPLKGIENLKAGFNEIKDIIQRLYDQGITYKKEASDDKSKTKSNDSIS